MAAPLAVHPVADLFPMLPDEELRDLAHDIAERGLLQPIVLDDQGRILDGRNRYAACELASVQPQFTTYDGDDPDGYALAVNITRRHMSASQRAIVVARAVRLAGISQRDGAQRFKLNQARIGQANTVLDYAPDLADQVFAGLPLHEAYRTARERKQAAESTEAAMGRLRAEAADLADQVTEEGLTLEAAQELLEERRREAALRAVVERVDQVRDADGAPAPTFTQRAESGAVTWAEAATLAQQWETERAESIERDRDRIRQVIAGWASVRQVRDRAGTPRIAELLNGLGDMHRAELDAILAELER